MPGGFERKIYDTCSYQQRVADSTSPYQYRTYGGAHINGNKCRIPQSQYVNLVDVESELKNQTRLASQCNGFKYNPKTKLTANLGVSTYDKLIPINPEPRVCPKAEKLLYFNSGLRKVTGTGFVPPNEQNCGESASRPRFYRSPYASNKPSKVVVIVKRK